MKFSLFQSIRCSRKELKFKDHPDYSIQKLPTSNQLKGIILFNTKEQAVIT